MVLTWLINVYPDKVSQFGSESSWVLVLYCSYSLYVVILPI